jgi:hypothetical protein
MRTQRRGPAGGFFHRLLYVCTACAIEGSRLILGVAHDNDRHACIRHELAQAQVALEARVHARNDKRRVAQPVFPPRLLELRVGIERDDVGLAPERMAVNEEV